MPRVRDYPLLAVVSTDSGPKAQGDSQTDGRKRQEQRNRAKKKGPDRAIQALKVPGTVSHAVPGSTPYVEVRCSDVPPNMDGGESVFKVGRENIFRSE